MLNTGCAPPPAADRIERLLVTRPAHEAATWASALALAGWPAQALPLIDIAEPADPALQQALAQARRHWADADALMFVSVAAVQHFFQGGVAPAPQGVPRTRFWAPGPGTARALGRELAAIGLDASHIDAPPADAAQFDSEALWPVVQPQLCPGHRVLIVRGLSRGGELQPFADDQAATTGVPGHGRDWLIHQCEAAGVRVSGCVAYERRPPVFDASARALMQAGAGAGSVWLFSSSEALNHLISAAPGVDWRLAAALVTHPRIGERARHAGFGRIVQSRPALSDVLGALESHWSPL